MRFVLRIAIGTLAFVVLVHVADALDLSRAAGMGLAMILGSIYVGATAR